MLGIRGLAFAPIRPHRYPEPEVAAASGDAQPPMNNEIRVHQAVSDVPPSAFEPGARPLRAATAPPSEAARPASQAMILFDGVTKTYRMDLKLSKVSGQWKVSDLAYVS